MKIKKKKKFNVRHDLLAVSLTNYNSNFRLNGLRMKKKTLGIQLFLDFRTVIHHI